MVCICTYVGSCYIDTSEDSINTYSINGRHSLMALMDGINGWHNGQHLLTALMDGIDGWH
jgi:hypothetical protein